MKNTITLTLLSILLMSCNPNPSKEARLRTLEAELAEMKENKMNEKEMPEKLLRHVVLFNFNDDATPAIVQQIEQQFAELPSKINAIHSFEWGTNNSPEGLDKGLTHCFLVTFLNEDGREEYLPHPDHLKFVDFIGPYVEDVTVVDYWTV